MSLRRAILACALCTAPIPAAALSLEFPSPATLAAEESTPMASTRVPIGPWQQDRLPTLQAEGALTRQAWQLTAEGMTTLQILKPLREQLSDAGFEILFECEDETCGGFDFRYAADLLPEPAMHVDLGDYRFITAKRDDADTPEYVCLMVSRSASRGFVNMVRVGPELAPEQRVFTSTKTYEEIVQQDAAPLVATLDTGLIGEVLEFSGHAVLDDLIFATGSSRLDENQFDSLEALAGYLLDNPDRRIVLVGHTDAEGALSSNMALSKKRAQSVRRRLNQDYGVPLTQMTADGVGYLSPMASNLSEDGRSQNRRVEVILTSTQ